MMHNICGNKKCEATLRRIMTYVQEEIEFFDNPNFRRHVG